MSTQMYKELSLDGSSYTIQMLPADQGLKLCTRLLKLVGEPIAELIKVQGDKTKVFEVLPTAIKTLASRMQEDEVVDLAKQLCSCVIKSGTSASLDREFNLYFRGRYGHLFKLLKEVVEYNFSDFLDALPLAISEVAPAAKQG